MLCFNWDSNKWAFGQGATDNVTGSTSTLGLGPSQTGIYGWGPQFFFTQSGYFGIGTRDPSHNLHVIGDTAINGTITTTGDATLNRFRFSQLNENGNSSYWAHLSVATGSTNNARMYIRAEDTSKTCSLFLTGNLYVDTDTLYVDATNDRVGINKTPSVALDVAGDAAIEGTLHVFNNDSITYNTAYESVIANTGDVVLKLQSGDTSSSYLAMGKYDDELKVGLSYWANSSQSSADI